jgi:hypothetical protein
MQAGLIFWLGPNSAIPPSRVVPVPVVRLDTRSTNPLLALSSDPTLFVLPHRAGFSGAGWMRIPQSEFDATDWTEPEPPRWLPLPTRQLAAAFKGFALTNAPPAFPTIVMAEPALTYPALPPVEPILMPSTVSVEGDLARRPLLSHLDLPVWTNTDLLSNSVVELTVDARGYAISAALLSGSHEVDQRALELARHARFAPAPVAGFGPKPSSNMGLTIGTLIFHWRTAPPVSTNAPAIVE